MELPVKQHGVVVAWVRDIELNARDRVALKELSDALFVPRGSFEDPEPPSAKMPIPSELTRSAASSK